MSLPELPAPFGNNALRGLVEIAPPDAVSWMPQTVGWLWVALIGLGLLCAKLARVIKAWHANRYRREAIKRLRALAANDEATHFLSELNALLKLTAIAGFSRERVAVLSGDAWAEFLNAHCTPEPFASHHQQLLATGAYSYVTLNTQEQRELLDAARHWIEQHRRPEHA